MILYPLQHEVHTHLFFVLGGLIYYCIMNAISLVDMQKYTNIQTIDKNRGEYEFYVELD